MPAETLHYPSKVEILSARLKKNPQSRLFLRLAEELGREGHHEAAVNTCLEGLKKHPGFMPARVSLARFYMDAERYPEAREHLERVLKGSPSNLKALKLLAEALKKLGSPELALDRLKEHIPYNPDDPELKSMIAGLESDFMGSPFKGESELEGLFPGGRADGTAAVKAPVPPEEGESERVAGEEPAVPSAAPEEALAEEGTGDREDEITTLTLGAR